MKEKKSAWPPKAKQLSTELHAQLSLNHKNWHALKNDSDRRAAELWSGALVHLLNEGKSSDIEDLIQQGLRWLNREISDPGCPHR